MEIYQLGIFKGKNNELLKQLRPIDDDLMERIVDEVLETDFLVDDPIFIYKNMQQSHYPALDYSKLEQKLQQVIELSNGVSRNVVQTEKQGDAFNRVFINNRQSGPIQCRFYLSPEPQKMHGMVYMLFQEFLNQHLPLQFKYQLQNDAYRCDRIVIYSDRNHKDDVERAIAKVYQAHPQLFEGSDRSLSWLYPSKIPNVYIAPETPGTSFGMQFAELIPNAKAIFDYLYQLKNSDSKISFRSKEEEQQVRNEVKKIVVSLLCREGMTLTSDDIPSQLCGYDDPDRHLSIIYQYGTGKLYQTFQSGNNKYIATYENSDTGRALLQKTAYGTVRPKVDQQVPGISIQKISLDDKEKNPQKVKRRPNPNEGSHS